MSHIGPTYVNRIQPALDIDQDVSLQCVAVCFSMLQCVAACCSVFQPELDTGQDISLQCVASVLQMCCSVLQ